MYDMIILDACWANFSDPCANWKRGIIANARKEIINQEQERIRLADEARFKEKEISP